VVKKQKLNQEYMSNQDNLTIEEKVLHMSTSIINLRQVCKFYKDLPNQNKALDYLQENISSEVLTSFADLWRQKEISTNKTSTNKLEVPYYSQLDNYINPHTTCNSSSNAMALKFLLPDSIKSDDEYLSKVLSYGESTDNNTQVKTLFFYGLTAKFRTNLNFSDLDNQLSKGIPVTIGILHHGSESNPSGGGHIICVVGKYTDGYLVHDPYGNLYDGYQTDTINGKFAKYSKSTLQARWQMHTSSNGWGMIYINQVR